MSDLDAELQVLAESFEGRYCAVDDELDRLMTLTAELIGSYGELDHIYVDRIYDRLQELRKAESWNDQQPFWVLAVAIHHTVRLTRGINWLRAHE